MEYFNDFLSRVLNLLSEFLFIFNKTLFKIGDSEVSIGTIVVFFASFYLLVIVSKNVRLLLLNKILVRSKLKKSFRESIANGVRITMMLIGTIIIIQAVGIDLSALSLLAGALGVGIGFGFPWVSFPIGIACTHNGQGGAKIVVAYVHCHKFGSIIQNNCIE